MALQLTTENVDRICFKVFMQGLGSLTVAQKYLVIGATSPTLPTSATIGEAGAALAVVDRWAQAYGMTGTDRPPDAWEQWLVAEAAARIALTARPERYRDFAQHAQKAFRDAIDTINTVTADVSTVQGQAITVQGIRYFVLNHMARRKPPVLPLVQDIDSHIQWVLNYLWNRNLWDFRKRMVDVTLPTTGIPSFGLSNGETFWANGSRRWYYTDIPNAFIEEDSSADDMALVKSTDTAYGVASGRPRYMRMQRSGTDQTWFFSPAPDMTYTLKAEVIVDGPGTPSSANDTAVFSKFPENFRPVIRDMVLARVMLAYNPATSETFWSRAIDQVEQMLPLYESKGHTTDTQSMRDVYNDAIFQAGTNSVGGRM